LQLGLHHWLVHSFLFECIIECMWLFAIQTMDDENHTI